MKAKLGRKTKVCLLVALEKVMCATSHVIGLYSAVAGRASVLQKEGRNVSNKPF